MSQTEADILKARAAEFARRDRLEAEMNERAKHPERYHSAAPFADEFDYDTQRRTNARKRARRARRSR